MWGDGKMTWPSGEDRDTKHYTDYTILLYYMLKNDIVIIVAIS